MEINPRLWQWHGLAAACGVNLAHIALRDLCGEEVSPTRMNPVARRRWSITFKADRRAKPQRPPYVDPLLALDDLPLAAAHLTRLVRPSPPRRRPR
jgi:hypothetical protein